MRDCEDAFIRVTFVGAEIGNWVSNEEASYGGFGFEHYCYLRIGCVQKVPSVGGLHPRRPTRHEYEFTMYFDAGIGKFRSHSRGSALALIVHCTLGELP